MRLEGWRSLRIEKKNPLKQGLKPITIKDMAAALDIEKKNPLKQGLKPTFSTMRQRIITKLKRRIH